MKNIVAFLIIAGSLKLIAQSEIKFIESVPESFKKNYNNQIHEYNPLHVGDVWQYYFIDYTSPSYLTTRIIQDSVINGKKYFKKISFANDLYPRLTEFISWERNDSITGNSYMLDFGDINEDNDTLDELLLDSLELPNHTRYTSYKYSFSDHYFFSGPKTTLIYDSAWVLWWGDTVMSRKVEYLELFWGEIIADKFGTVVNWSESPERHLTGAIINGKKYGTIVEVKDNFTNMPTQINLYQNYPNPFNPETTISYSLQKANWVTLKIFDVLGNELAILEDDYKYAWHYSIKFTANNLPTGVYFYSLITGSKTITKPMVLIK